MARKKKTEPAIRLVWRKIDELIPYEGNAKLHPQEQVDRLGAIPAGAGSDRRNGPRGSAWLKRL